MKIDKYVRDFWNIWVYFIIVGIVGVIIGIIIGR